MYWIAVNKNLKSPNNLIPDP